VLELACRALKLANPADGIDNLKVQKAQPDPFTADEVEIILSKALELEGEDVRDWFEFAFFAGMRVSEQIALPWSAVDLRLGTAAVRGAVVMGKAKDRTKTHTERTVELNDRALAVIQRQRAKTALQPHGRVFATFGRKAFGSASARLRLIFSASSNSFRAGP
jgi:integrase